MNQELKDSIVHTLATMVLDNADWPAMQLACRETIRSIVNNESDFLVVTHLQRCRDNAANILEMEAISALISAIDWIELSI